MRVGGLERGGDACGIGAGIGRQVGLAGRLLQGMLGALNGA